MKTWQRRTLWGLGVLFGVPLVLGAAWAALNSRDAAPQPWPQALALPGNTVAEGDNLAHALAGHARPADGFRLGDCAPDDCLAAWRALVAQMPAQRETHAPFLAACEALGARTQGQYEEPLPARLTPTMAFSTQADVMGCHTWLTARGVEAALAGDGPSALRWLQQADRLDRATLSGSRSLIAHLLAVNQWGRKLQTLVAVATLQPALGPALAPLADLPPRELLDAQQRWVRVEANFNRAVVDTLREPCAGVVPSGAAEAWLCKLSAPLAQPEYQTQRFAQRWLAVHEQLQQAESPTQALPAVKQRLQEGSAGWWPKVRHTIPTVLDEVAWPAFVGYFDRAADLALSAEATRLWLQDARAPLPERATDVLRERLSASPAGGWTLRSFDPQSARRLPLRWQPPPA